MSAPDVACGVGSLHDISAVRSRVQSDGHLDRTLVLFCYRFVAYFGVA